GEGVGAQVHPRRLQALTQWQLRLGAGRDHRVLGEHHRHVLLSRREIDRIAEVLFGAAILERILGLDEQVLRHLDSSGGWTSASVKVTTPSLYRRGRMASRSRKPVQDNGHDPDAPELLQERVA